MAALQRFALDFCPINTLRPNFPSHLTAQTQYALAGIYDDAVFRDPDGFNRLVRGVYSLDPSKEARIENFDQMRERFPEGPSPLVSYRSLLGLNLNGCVWRTSPALYKELKHSFQGADGDASYTWNTFWCTVVLLISCLTGSFKVSSRPSVQIPYSIANLALYNSYFMFTRYGEYVALAATIHLLVLALFGVLRKGKPQLPEPLDAPKNGFGDIVVCLRGIIMSATVVAILAYDSLYFDRRCGKTFYSGYSAMDVGCGFMVMHSGCMAGLSQSPKKRGVVNVIKRNWGLLLLGVVRLLCTAAVHYDVPVEEYGVHWNFFMSLGVTKILSELILSIVPGSTLALVPVSIMVTFEYLLKRFDLVNLLPAIPRDNVLTANKEGIIAVPNSITMFFIGYLVTGVCRKLHGENKLKSGAWFLSSVTLLSLLGSAIMHHLGFPSSRTLTNARFVMNTGSIVFFGFLLLWMTEMLADKWFYLELLRCIGKHSFACFLLANLLTGAVNLFLQPLLLPFSIMYILVSTYAATCFLFTVYLECGQLRPLGKHASRKE